MSNLSYCLNNCLHRDRQPNTIVLFLEPVRVILWYPKACNFSHLKHRLYSHLEKNLIEQVMQYFKDKTEFR